MPRQLDLRSGKPVWSAYRSPAVPAERLTRDAKTDVLIVGMGISGAMMAEALTRDGHAVICIDRRGPLKGSTAATTALVEFEIDQPLIRLSRMIGGDAARQAWIRSRLSLLNLRGRIAELDIRCRSAETPSLYLAGNRLDAPELRSESEARREAGIGASFLPRKKLREDFGIDRAAAILSHGNLALDPRKLTSGLLMRALQRKARFYAPAEATAIEDTRLGVTVATRQGPRIHAGHLVLATGYELLDIVPRTGHRLISTWAIATRPQPEKIWPLAALIWEASDPYLYLRATSDGRVICGGEDEEFTDEERRDALTAQKTVRLEEKLGKIFPRLDTAAEFAWTGSFGATDTGLPIIGSVPGHPRIYAVMGYGGNGITSSQIGSEIVCASIAGREDADANLFAFKA
ncbi:FAD-binding oxidoreductase [Mesorhizobium sp. WSM3859]|uniref:NAD(P)/FAD-dependent oxidoreductase n=1 Tax=Mesorhizobium sp. WSM3859 TaxID=2029402 RepID=UPI000BB0377B|nr:FAD-binding oxidoreductase [Mesorhizobium sp. WSM3859]PBC07678.1 FAD-dependent oxidoreductase [Mesorhizobium sp. WSM3859]